MKKLLTLILGERAAGEPIPQPTFRSMYPKHRPDVNQWGKDYNVGSRYGYRGSFYENKPNVIKLIVAQ
jgi:hypothetical protein